MKRRFVSFGCCLSILAVVALGLRAQQADLRKALEAAFQKGLALQKQGKFLEAIEDYNKAVELAPKVFGNKHVNTGLIYATAGFANWSAGRFAEAEKHYQRGVDILQAIPKSEKPLAQGLANLSTTQDNLGKYEEAEKNARRALALYEAMSPRDDLKIALTLMNFGVLLTRMARYNEAVDLLQRSVDLRTAKLGKNHLETLDAKFNLAGTYRHMRRDKEAEALAREVLEIRQARLGPEHLSVAASLSELGSIAFNTGRYQEAEQHFVDALRIREKLLGKDHPSNADYLHNLAVLYTDSSRAGEAEKLYLKALAIREAAVGPDHPSVARSLSNMSNLYVYLGRLDEAEKVLLRSVKIHESRGLDHPDLGDALNNLAGLYRVQGRHKDALAIYQRCLAIDEKRLGKDSLQAATLLNNLGVLYNRMGNPAGALPLLRRALKIREAHYGVGHRHAFEVYNNLALAHWALGNFPEADILLERSEELFKGKDGGVSAGGLHNRARLNMAMGRVREALAFEDRCLTMHQSELRNVFAFSSESTMHAFTFMGREKLPALVSMAFQAEDPAAATLAFDWTLRLKGIVFDTLCRYRQAQHLLSGDEELQQTTARFRSQKERLANLALNPPSGKDAPKLRKEMEDAQKEVDQLEKELTRTIAQKVPDVVAGRESITTEMLRKRLPADSALIEFMRLSPQDFKRKILPPERYFAFVLTPDREAPRLIDLGPAREIDAGIETVRKEFTDFQEKLKDCDTAEEVRALEKAQEKQFAQRCAPLYRLLFAPLRQELGKASLLYVAPDGALNRLPFEALVDADGAYLVERFRFAYLSSGRDLLRTVPKPAEGTIVFANPDFKLDAQERLVQVEKLLPKKEMASAFRGQSSRELRSAGWKNLPGAAAEAKDIQKLLGPGKYGPVKTYVGPEALEEVLKAMPAPRVLHLATHGFFLDRAADAAPPPEEDEGEGAGAGWTRGRLKRMDNPLLRSGIVLAGANTIGDKDAAARVDDGWVTAEEIALLNLQGTELVVLSACQTGLGDIKSGEGVQGLRRAFLHAGAQTLVTSLFEVPDMETRELMQRFYSGINAGAGKLRSLHAAQLGFIDQRRKTQGAAHPFFWASFVLVGNPH